MTDSKESNQAEHKRHSSESALIGLVSHRVTQMVNISDIQMDRYPMNPTTLSLIDYMRTDGEIPPIKLAKKSTGGFLIKDGRHRVLASKLLGLTKINAKFSLQPMISSAG